MGMRETYVYAIQRKGSPWQRRGARGEAPLEKGRSQPRQKNEIWSAINTIATWQNDIVADIQVTGGSAATPAAAPAAAKTYTVQAGDTLSKIAKEHLGSAGLVHEDLRTQQGSVVGPGQDQAGAGPAPAVNARHDRPSASASGIRDGSGGLHVERVSRLHCSRQCHGSRGGRDHRCGVRQDRHDARRRHPMPPIGLLLGNVDFSSLFAVLDTSKGVPVSLADAKTKGIPVIAYGQFLNDIIGFLIVALAVFLIVKQVNRIKSAVDKPSAAATVTKECQFCASTISIKALRCPNCTSELAPAGPRR